MVCLKYKVSDICLAAYLNRGNCRFRTASLPWKGKARVKVMCASDAPETTRVIVVQISSGRIWAVSEI
jgi:hypothetical protein